jgi:hypothetical protein
VKDLDAEGIIHTAEHPFLYFVDGHTSHISLKLFKFCRENHIELFVFYPNATHILQMCDFAVFGSLKAVWKKEVQLWKIESKNREISMTDFVRILKRVQDKVMTAEKIVNGFRATGVYPLDPKNCHLERCLRSSKSSGRNQGKKTSS